MKNLNVAELAHMAGIGSPSHEETSGGQFLKKIVGVVEDIIADIADLDEAIDRTSGMVDQCLATSSDVNMWAAFTEMRLYNEDISELLGNTVKIDDLRLVPSSGLYLAGTRLAFELLNRYFPVPCVQCDGFGNIDGIGGRSVVCNVCNGNGKVRPIDL